MTNLIRKKKITKVVESIAHSKLEEARLLAFVTECYSLKVVLAQNIVDIPGEITKEKVLKAIDEFFEQEVV